MKLFKDVKINETYAANVTIEERKDGSLLFVATCGETKREHVMAPAPNHEYSEEQFLEDIETAKLAVATEAAGHEHQRLLRAKFFAEDKVIDITPVK
jgi:hypothetical protein